MRVARRPSVWPSASTRNHSRSISPGLAVYVFITERGRTYSPPAADSSTSPGRSARSITSHGLLTWSRVPMTILCDLARRTGNGGLAATYASDLGRDRLGRGDTRGRHDASDRLRVSEAGASRLPGD